jgi:hypothetical protein
MVESRAYGQRRNHTNKIFRDEDYKESIMTQQQITPEMMLAMLQQMGPAIASLQQRAVGLESEASVPGPIVGGPSSSATKLDVHPGLATASAPAPQAQQQQAAPKWTPPAPKALTTPLRVIPQGHPVVAAPHSVQIEEQKAAPVLAERVECVGLTKAGSKCKKLAMPSSNGFCTIHANQFTETKKVEVIEVKAEVQQVRGLKPEGTVRELLLQIFRAVESQVTGNVRFRFQRVQDETGNYVKVRDDLMEDVPVAMLPKYGDFVRIKGEKLPRKVCKKTFDYARGELVISLGHQQK